MAAYARLNRFKYRVDVRHRFRLNFTTANPVNRSSHPTPISQPNNQLYRLWRVDLHAELTHM